MRSRFCVLLILGIALFTAVGVALPAFFGTPNTDPPGRATNPALKHVTLYDADPAHLWNHIHSALFVRIARDGTRFGEDELEPLLWSKTKFLITGEHHEYVLTLLDEFLAKEGHKLIKDPLKRVLFQHDLWAIFDWLANPNATYQFREDEVTPEARALQIRLAKIIRRLGLPSDQIGKLPDNYKAALDAKTFPPTHTPDKPEAAFLPPDLFDPEGPWVVLGMHMASAAPVHIRVTHGRSAFLVLLKLPEGRKATSEYLEKLAAFPGAALARSAVQVARLSPDIPQFPVGTQVALVREMLTIDAKGKVQPTRLVESIQFRVYREIPKAESAHPERLERLKGKQDFYEFRLTRKALFSERNGGLHAVAPKEKEIGLLLPGPGPDDQFEDGPPTQPGTSPIMEACVDCHSQPGIHSVEAYRRGFIQLPKPARLAAYDRDQQEQAAMLKKWEDYSWGLLQGLMEMDK